MSSTIEIKTQNLDSIRRSIRERGYATKAAVSQYTGLSVATCNNLLNEMHRAGELLISSQEKSQGGRRASQYVYNKDYFHVLTLHIKRLEQSCFLSYHIVNAIGETIDGDTLRPHSIDADYLLDCLSLILKKEPLVQAIAVAVPGIVAGGVLKQCDIAELEGVDLQAILEERFGIQVIIENDMNLIAYSVYHSLKGECQSLVVIDFPMDDPPGSGIVIDGKIYKGYRMFAGELAYALDEGGIPREKQHVAEMSQEDFIRMVVKSVVMMACILDPGKIILMSKRLDEHMLAIIKERCEKHIQYGCSPSIMLGTDYYGNCSSGMIHAVLNSMCYNFQLTV